MTKTGIGYVLGFAEESTYGTAAASADHYLLSARDTMKKTVELIEGDGDLAYQQVLGDFLDPGNSQLAGGIEFDAQFGGGWWMFLAHLLGLDVTTTGAGPDYTHTLSLGGALGGSDDITDEGITLFADREGQQGSATSKTAIIAGFRPSAMELAFELNKRTRVSVEGVARAVTQGNRLTPTYSTLPRILSPSRNSSPTDFFQWNSTAYLATAATIRIEREQEQRRKLEDPLIVGQSPGGLLMVTGTVEVEAENTGAGTGGVWFDDYEDKALRELVITAEGATAAQQSLAFTLHEAVLTEPGTPEVVGPGVIRQTIGFKGYYDSANSEIGSAVLKTTESTAWT